MELSLWEEVPRGVRCSSGVRTGLKTYKDGTRYAYPTHTFFEIFAQKQCPIIIGLDIHNPEYFLTDEYLNRALSVVEGSQLNIQTDYDLISAAKERKKRFW